MFQKNQARKTGTIYGLYVLNCFKYFLVYILGQNLRKNQTRKILNCIKFSCITFCLKMTRYS